MRGRHACAHCYTPWQCLPERRSARTRLCVVVRVPAKERDRVGRRFPRMITSARAELSHFASEVGCPPRQPGQRDRRARPRLAAGRPSAIVAVPEAGSTGASRLWSWCTSLRLWSISMGDAAVGKVGEGGSETLQGPLPILKRSRKTVADGSRSGSWSVCDRRRPRRGGRSTPPGALSRPWGRCRGPKLRTVDGQDRHRGFEVQRFLALEVFGLNGGPKRVERYSQWLDCGPRLRGKQAAQERAAFWQRFNPGGPLSRRVVGSLVDVETRAFDAQISIFGLQLGDPIEVLSGRRVIANATNT